MYNRNVPTYKIKADGLLKIVTNSKDVVYCIR